jgi:hypothetical protein
MDGVDLKDHPQTTITTQPPSSHTKICAHMFFHGFKLTTLHYQFIHTNVAFDL